MSTERKRNIFDDDC